jgi:hypothetical protein
MLAWMRNQGLGVARGCRMGGGTSVGKVWLRESVDKGVCGF